MGSMGSAKPINFWEISVEIHTLRLKKKKIRWFTSPKKASNLSIEIPDGTPGNEDGQDHSLRKSTVKNLTFLGRIENFSEIT